MSVTYPTVCHGRHAADAAGVRVVIIGTTVALAVGPSVRCSRSGVIHIVTTLRNTEAVSMREH